MYERIIFGRKDLLFRSTIVNGSKYTEFRGDAVVPIPFSSQKQLEIAQKRQRNLLETHILRMKLPPQRISDVIFRSRTVLVHRLHTFDHSVEIPADRTIDTHLRRFEQRIEVNVYLQCFETAYLFVILVQRLI